MSSTRCSSAGRRCTSRAAASLALGLFFIFVWTPLPWGWKGIDGYDTISLALANGAPFPTVHLVWGYAYFLAAFYWLFGNQPAIPLVAQAVLNASIPVMLYHLVRVEMTERIAVMAALLAGFLSFNTIYASTQASDSVCTVLVVAAILCFQRGERAGRPLYFGARGSPERRSRISSARTSCCFRHSSRPAISCFDRLRAAA